MMSWEALEFIHIVYSSHTEVIGTFISTCKVTVSLTQTDTHTHTRTDQVILAAHVYR